MGLPPHADETGTTKGPKKLIDDMYNEADAFLLDDVDALALVAGFECRDDETEISCTKAWAFSTHGLAE